MKKSLQALRYTALLLLAASMLIPFLWMISTSLMGELEVYQFPPKLLPSEFKWSNFAEAMTLQPFWRFSSVPVWICVSQGITKAIRISVERLCIGRTPLVL